MNLLSITRALYIASGAFPGLENWSVGWLPQASKALGVVQLRSYPLAGDFVARIFKKGAKWPSDYKQVRLTSIVGRILEILTHRENNNNNIITKNRSCQKQKKPPKEPQVDWDPPSYRARHTKFSQALQIQRTVHVFVFVFYWGIITWIGMRGYGMLTWCQQQLQGQLVLYTVSIYSYTSSSCTRLQNPAETVNIWQSLSQIKAIAHYRQEPEL